MDLAEQKVLIGCYNNIHFLSKYGFVEISSIKFPKVLANYLKFPIFTTFSPNLFFLSKI